MKFILDNNTNYKVNVTLFLTKNERKESISFSFVIEPDPRLNSSTVKLSSNNNEMKNDYSDSILIIPNSRGMKNEDLILNIKFLDISLTTSMFTYLWTVNQDESDKIYLNGRTESSVRIKNNNLLIGRNLIELKFTEISNKEENIKTYIFNKNQSPFGGICNVSPQIGNSLETLFTFSSNNWISNNLPLSYNYYFTSSLSNVNISLLSHDILETEFSTTIVPVANLFYLDVMDSSGLVTTVNCKISVLKDNKNSFDLNKLLNSLTETSQQLLAIEAFRSNYFIMSDDNNSNNNSEKTKYKEIKNNTLNFVENLLIPSESPSQISKNIGIITSQVKGLDLKSTIDVETINRIDNIIEFSVNNIDCVIFDLTKVSNIIDMINTNLDNMKILKSITGNNDSKSNNYLDSSDKTDKYLDSIHNSLFNNFIEGQTVSFINNNFISQLSKISTKNNYEGYSLAISDKSDEDSNFIDSNLKYRILSSRDNLCTDTSVVCFNSTIISNINSNNKNSSSFGISGKINRDNILNINSTSFSINSLKLNFIDDSGKFRLLQDNSSVYPFNIKYETNLNVPDLNLAGISTMIEKTTCVQYNQNNQIDKYSNICETWYDYDRNKVICVCSGSGLIVNIVDQTIAKMTKLSQFPALEANLSKLYLTLTLL